MELQDAVRLAEMIKANKSDAIYKKQTMWNFFNRLFRYII